MYIYDWVTLLFTYHNIVNWLYSNKELKITYLLNTVFSMDINLETSQEYSQSSDTCELSYVCLFWE